MAKGRKKKSKAASVATTAALVTATGLTAGAALIPSTAVASIPGVCSQYNDGYGGGVQSNGFDSLKSYDGSCRLVLGDMPSGIVGSGGMNYHPYLAGVSKLTFLTATTTDNGKVSAMWLNGDDGTINFDVGPAMGQIIKINPNGRMNGLSDGVIASGSSDAITGNQVFALQSKIEQIIDNGSGKYFHANSNLADSTATGTDSIAVGPVAKAQSTGDIAMGNSALANGAGSNATAVGANAKATSTATTAVGGGATATHHYSVALGQDSTTDRTSSVSVGNGSWQRQITFMAKGTEETDAVNVSQLKGVTRLIGGGATVDGSGNVSNTISVDGKTYNTVAEAIAANKGGGSNPLAVTYDDSNKNKVTLNNGGAAATLANVAAGAVNSTSKEGINGSQLYGTAKSVADALGGGSSVDANGKVTPPGYTVGGGTQSNVGDALNNIDGRVTNLIQGKAGLVQQAAAGANLTVGKDTDGAAVVFNTQAGTTRQLKGVSEGIDNTDAVNVKQLNDKLAGIGGGKNSVAYDGDDHLQITLTGKDGAPTKITNVADGAVAKGSKDAVNGDQMFKAMEKVEEIAPKLKYIKFGKTDANEARASGENSTAIGGEAFSSGKNALAVGMNARATGNDTLASGVDSLAAAAGAVALGSSANALGINSVALGAGSVTNGGDINVVSIGDADSGLKRRITNVADGTSKTDAATVGQVGKMVSDALGKTRSLMVMPAGNPVSSTPPEKLIVAGPTNLSDQIEATGQEALAIGLNTHAVANNTVSVGSNVTTVKKESVVVGQNINVNGERAVVLGSNVSAISNDAVVIGNGGSAVASEAAYGVAIGTNAAVKKGAMDSVVIGHEAKANAADSVVLGHGSNDDSRANTVSVGSTVGSDIKRQIINVAKGTQGTDAVNVDQLKSVTDALGGKAGINTDGTIKAPEYVLDNGAAKPNNVGDAITNIDGRITNVINGKAGLVQQAAAGANLTVGKDTNGAAADFTGTAGARKLIGVADGTVASSSKEAVNGGQLYGTAQSVATGLGGGSTVDSNGKVSAPSYKLDKGTVTATNVGDAISNLDGRIGNVVSGTAGLVQQAAAGANLTVGKDTNGAAADFTGTAGARKLIGVADGTVASGSKEAVTGGQLFDVKTTVTNITNGTAGLVQQAATGANLTVGKDTDGTAVVFNTKTGTTRQLKGVSEGIDNTDAVNVKQLNDKLAALPSNPNAVAYDDATHTQLTLNKGAGPTKISNVADGSIAKGSKDAVNGDQLFGAVDTITKSVEEIAPKLKYIKFGHSEANEARASGENSIAIGGEAFASGNNALALGLNARATVKDTLASGVDSLAGAAGAVALGSGSSALGVNSVALGAGSVTAGGDLNVVSLGDLSRGISRRITNVADGIAKTDAATVGQMDSAIKKAFEAKSGSVSTMSASLMPAGNPVSSTPPEKLIVAGPTNLADQIEATGQEALAIGLNTHAVADNTVSVGSNVTTVKKDSVAVGQNVNINGERAVVIGSNVSAISNDAVVIGNGGSTVASEATYGVAIGTNAAVKKGAMDSVVIGHEAKANAADSVVLGHGSNDDSRANTVSVGSTVGGDIKRQITNVANGTLDNDAVNVSQLKGMASVIGGGAAIGADGKVTKPTFDIAGTPLNSVGDALEALETLASTGSVDGVKYDTAAHDKVTFDGPQGTLLTGLKDGAIAKDSKDAVTGNQLNDTNVAISKIVQGTAGLVQQAKAGDDLTVGVATDGKGVSFTGTAGDRILHGVAGGKIDNDAVNISQLKDVASVISKGAAVDAATGKVTLPKIEIAGKTYDDILGALDGISKDGASNPLGVAYDDATKGKVTLNKGAGQVTIANVKDGVDTHDAVNVGQLAKAGLIDPGTGQALEAVVYDKGSNKGSVSFGGATGTVLKNVGAGTVNATSKEAVNGSQLFGTAQSVADALGGNSKVNPDGTVTKPAIELIGGTKFDNVTDAIKAIDAQAKTGNPLGVAYDDESKAKVTLNKGAGPVTIANVKAGEADDEAVNVKQLKDAGLIDPDGKSLHAVTYDSDAKDSITLGGVGSKTPVTLKNVADATKSDEAVNLGQLSKMGLVDPGTGTTLEAVVYDAGSNKGAVTFGGGVNGTVLNNVADGRIETGSRQAINGGQLAAIRDALRGDITNIDARVTNIEKGGIGGKPDYIAVNGSGGATGKPTPATAGDSPGVAVGFDSNASGKGASAIGDHAVAAGMDSVSLGNNAKTTQTGANSVALGNDSLADRANTVSVGSEGHERTISNVARGSADTDAVNVGLLNERIGEAKAYTDKAINDVWSNIHEEIDHSNRQANRGIAAASALINVTPYVPGHTTVNAGVAGYRGESALGVGVSRWSDNGRVNLNAGVSAAQGDEPVFRVGIGYIF